jgi:hypothetical protein
MPIFPELEYPPVGVKSTPVTAKETENSGGKIIEILKNCGVLYLD